MLLSVVFELYEWNDEFVSPMNALLHSCDDEISSCEKSLEASGASILGLEDCFFF